MTPGSGKLDKRYLSEAASPRAKPKLIQIYDMQTNEHENKFLPQASTLG